MGLVKRVKGYSYKNVYKKYRKAIWAVLGGTTAAGVLAVGDAIGYELDPGLAGLIAAVIAGFAARQAKKNIDLPTRNLSSGGGADPNRAEL